MNALMQTATRSVQLRVMSTPTSSLTDAVAIARRHHPGAMPAISPGPNPVRSLDVRAAAA